MNMKYLIALCVISCVLSFGAHAFNRIEIKKPTPAVAVLASSEMKKFDKEISDSVHKIVGHIPFSRIPTDHIHELFKHGADLITAIIGIVRSIIHICTEITTARSRPL